MRLLTMLAFAGLCGAASVSAAPVNRFLIVPGRSIGQTALGPNGSAELKRLPPPVASDNGMMQTRLVWTSHASGRTDTLFIHGVRNGALAHVKPVGGTTIDTIRITSPQFHTRSGISTKSTLAEVRRRFPRIRRDRFHPQLFVDAQCGIAFEFPQPPKPASRCLGISIFPPTADADQIPPTQSQVNMLLQDSCLSGQPKSLRRGPEKKPWR